MLCFRAQVYNNKGYGMMASPPLAASTPTMKTELLRTSSSSSCIIVEATGCRGWTKAAAAPSIACRVSAMVPIAKDRSETALVFFCEGKSEKRAVGRNSFIVF